MTQRGVEQVITRRQVEVLEFLGGFRAREGYSPTMRETASALGLSSVATVAEHIESLEKMGLVRRQKDRARSALPTGRGRAFLSRREAWRGPAPLRAEPAGAGSAAGRVIPLMGTIAAGEPIEAIAVPEEIEVPASLATGTRCYALKVSGQSMIDEGIFDGDFVVVEQKPVPENGETVVALIDGERATLKKFYRERAGKGERIRLQPANPDMEPIIPGPGERVEIQGKVRGVLRLL